MIVVRGMYTAPLEDVDAVRADHLAWITEHVDAGRVVAAGRTAPPTGSVLLLSGADAGAALALLADDPYVQAGVASYAVEAVFTPVVHASGFEPFVS